MAPVVSSQQNYNKLMTLGFPRDNFFFFFFFFTTRHDNETKVLGFAEQVAFRRWKELMIWFKIWRGLP